VSVMNAQRHQRTLLKLCVYLYVTFLFIILLLTFRLEGQRKYSNPKVRQTAILLTQGRKNGSIRTGRRAYPPGMVKESTISCRRPPLQKWKTFSQGLLRRAPNGGENQSDSYRETGLQGYLTHEKTPTPPGRPPIGP